MGQKRFKSEQIIATLREAEVEVSRDQSVPQACRKIGVTEQTYYRWRKAYGGLRLDQAKRLKDVERENTRSKRVVADQALDIAILKEASSGNL
jgi:transposase-like protein